MVCGYMLMIHMIQDELKRDDQKDLYSIIIR